MLHIIIMYTVYVKSLEEEKFHCFVFYENQNINFVNSTYVACLENGTANVQVLTHYI